MLLSRKLDLEIGPMVQGHVETEDNVQLLYQTFGEGPAIVFANGIGVRYPGAVKQISALRGRYRVVCWDYRGVGQSVMADPGGDVSMPRHARDIRAILDHLSIERAIFVGWSMGLQVALEVIRQEPGRVAGLVGLLGTYARPFRTAFPWPIAAGLESAFALLQQHPQVPQAALELAVALPRVAFSVLSRALFVGRDADTEVFAANVRSVAGVEKSLYLRTLLALAQHDASDILPNVRCPTLVICGERDHLTPPRVARHMADLIPGAEYREVKGGTHFSLIEQPQVINRWLRDFADRVLGSAVARPVVAARGEGKRRA
jgi:pimeloyl-ACP methyl ester carboxylesterase